MTKYYSLNDNIVLRKEYFGGIIFNKNTGTIIDLDQEAFLLLKYIDKNNYLNKEEIMYLISKSSRDFKVHSDEITAILKKLVENKILKCCQFKKIVRKKDMLLTVEVDWPNNKILSAPETVHWAATYRCHADCPDCYARRHQKLNFKELSLKESYEMIDILAQQKVFQLAIGGGEPLLRKDLPEITDYAQKQGLIVHLTTGIENFNKRKLKQFSGKITSLQIGLNHNNLLKNVDREMNKIRIALKEAKNLGFKVGVNLVLTREVVNNLTSIIKLLNMVDIKRIVLLRFKPSLNKDQWLKQNPSADELLKLESKLNYVIKEYRDINFRFDCALSFLERKLSPKQALSAGIRGCVAGDRIIAVDPAGGVYPCSQLVDKEMKIGNIIKDNFETLYFENSVIKKYRSFRKNKSYKKSFCHICEAEEFCGGCRVFSNNALGGDPGCPEPIINDLKEATVDEIEEWIKDDFESYPSWLNK